MNPTTATNPTKAELDRESMIAWEAIMGIERLHRSAKIHKEPARERRRILRVAGELLGTRSLAWVPIHRDDEVVFEGDRLLSAWDCVQLTRILADRPGWEESGYVLINDAQGNHWGTRFPRVLNLLAVPVAEKTLSGWVLALNKSRVAGDGPRGRTLQGAEHEGPNRGSPRSCHSAARMRRCSCRSPPCSASRCGPPCATSTSRIFWLD